MIAGFPDLIPESVSIPEVHAITDLKKDNIDCNNINLNLNGLNISAIPDTLSNLLQSKTETEGAESGINNFNGKDYSFVCVNNNDNEFIISQSTPPTPSMPPIGALDLAVANVLSNEISILLGNGNGTFVTPAVNYGVGDDPLSVAVGDFNNDTNL
ncbi:MAG TPA: VCBS repeat-containing protein, partial [Nitrososphaeraceae archaeon]|nr:VCBS repeat-containing protein [Nitrososphaeraceae archaeon]